MTTTAARRRWLTRKRKQPGVGGCRHGTTGQRVLHGTPRVAEVAGSIPSRQALVVYQMAYQILSYIERCLERSSPQALCRIGLYGRRKWRSFCPVGSTGSD